MKSLKAVKRQIPTWNKRTLELKAALPLSDKDWCKEIGILQSNLKGYTEGTRSFTIKQLIRVAKLHNTSMDYLCGLTNMKAKPTEKLNPLAMIEEGLRILKSKST